MKKAFNSKLLNKYLKELSEIMIERNVPISNIVLVGGAVLALAYRFGRSTTDIDICIKEKNPQLYDCCLELARRYNLDDDWMNGAVMRSPSFSTRLFDKVYLYKSYNNRLNVYMISDIDLFCMKLVSYRAKDFNDLVIISKRLKRNKITQQDIISNFIYLYGGTYLLDKTRLSFLNKHIN